MPRNDMPFQIVVLTGFSGDPEVPLPRPRERRLVTVSRRSLPVLLKAHRPRLKLRGADAEGSWAVSFSELADFSEASIARQIATAGANESEALSVASAARRDAAFCALCSAWHGLDFLLRAAEGRPEEQVGLSTRERLEAADALGQSGDPRLDGEQWVWMPAGTFLVGTQREDERAIGYDPCALKNESPCRKVVLPGYRVSRFPVTVADYTRFIADSGYENAEYWRAGGFAKWKRPDQ